ncbi:hypothetical protein DL96DRAFT_1626603, partial [Flagelloscypha sp. PMI_526]
VNVLWYTGNVFFSFTRGCLKHPGQARRHMFSQPSVITTSLATQTLIMLSSPGVTNTTSLMNQSHTISSSLHATISDNPPTLTFGFATEALLPDPTGINASATSSGSTMSPTINPFDMPNDQSGNPFDGPSDQGSTTNYDYDGSNTTVENSTYIQQLTPVAISLSVPQSTLSTLLAPSTAPFTSIPSQGETSSLAQSNDSRPQRGSFSFILNAFVYTLLLTMLVK